MLTCADKSGEAFLSDAVVNGKFALRACIWTSASLVDIEVLPPLLSRLGEDVCRESDVRRALAWLTASRLDSRMLWC